MIKMGYEIVEKGKARLGKGPYEIREVQANAVVILRPTTKAAKTASETGVAVINLPPTDPISVDDAVEQTVARYLERTGEDPDNIEAVLIGGVFKDNRLMDDGILVYDMHDLAARYALESLAVRGLRTTTVPSHERSTKMVRVEPNGDFEYDEEFRGFNDQEAQMSYDDYFMKIGRHRCCD